MDESAQKSPETLVREVVELCTGCEMCRDLMADSSCLFFQELFRLVDAAAGNCEKISPAQLRSLLELCNMCGICPCESVRADLRRARDGFVAREGLKPTIRILEDVQRLSKTCGAYPRLANLLLGKQPTATVLKRIAGIHPDRKLPKFPEESFVAWAKKKGIDQKRGGHGRKVAYFAGCTAQFLFPDVAKASVTVLEHNGVEVYLPEQKCCGMPSLLEGDRAFTQQLASANLETLGDVVGDGYDIVCSCPTCGYVLTKLLSEDEGYFAGLNGARRSDVATHTFDLGEYLKQMHDAGELDTRLKPVPDRMAHFPPCHLRELSIGQPWSELLSLVPGISTQDVGDAFDCCGMAGIMGFKREFHEASITMGVRLAEKIRSADPERLVTECLSCRIQFNQMLPYKVFHPVEILKEAYGI